MSEFPREYAILEGPLVTAWVVGPSDGGRGAVVSSGAQPDTIAIAARIEIEIAERTNETLGM